MITTIVSAPAIQPVTLAEQKDYMAVTHTDDDAMIQRLINTAVLYVEQYTCRKMITQTWKMFLQEWPPEIYIYYGNLQSITHVKYTDVDGTQSTFSTSYYDVDTDSIPGRITLGYGDSWPSDSLHPKNPIEIQFVTGYGDATTDVPDDVRNAIMLMVNHYYENREPTISGSIIANIPKSVDALLYNHRIWKWCL